jgi:hypothetical protein
VDEVVRHRERKIAADRAGCGVGRVRRSDRRPDDRDRGFALDGERQGGPGRNELDQLAEERLLRVLGVVGLRVVSPASCRRTASGLISTNVCSTAIGAGVYS